MKDQRPAAKPESNIMNHRFVVVTIAFLLTCSIGSDLHAQTVAALTVDVNQPKAPVSPMLYGLMTEEINYSYDGGLYAELWQRQAEAQLAEEIAQAAE